MKAGVELHISDHLYALLEEYRALYSLAMFRLEALDRRVPLTAGALAAVLSGMDVVPPDSQLLVLCGTPLVVVWFVRGAVNHARSFEDVLRRLEQVEHAVNEVLGKPVLRFQSSHPSRAHQVGGRTSRESISSVLATAFVFLGAAAFRAQRSGLLSPGIDVGYYALLAVVALAMALEGVRLGQYRYRPGPTLYDGSGRSPNNL